jgi:hypothetical protein
MPSPGMLRCVTLIGTDVSDKRSSRIIRMTRIGVSQLLVTAHVVPRSPILVTLMTEALCSSETSVPTRATRRNIPEDGILLIPICSKYSIINIKFLSRPKKNLSTNDSTRAERAGYVMYAISGSFNKR